MPAPKTVNAECCITARMTMDHIHDLERYKARVEERFPNWKERAAWFGWRLYGDQFFENGVMRPADWAEIGMMFALNEMGKL